MKEWIVEQNSTHVKTDTKTEEIKIISPLTTKKSSKNFSQINKVNEHVIPNMEQHMQLKGYSVSTQQTYLNEMTQFLKTLSSQPADAFTTQRLKDYLQYCHVTFKSNYWKSIV